MVLVFCVVIAVMASLAIAIGVYDIKRMEQKHQQQRRRADAMSDEGNWFAQMTYRDQTMWLEARAYAKNELGWRRHLAPVMEQLEARFHAGMKLRTAVPTLQ